MNRRLRERDRVGATSPRRGAKRNLLAEGVPDEAIRVTGNTVIDALLSV